MLFSVMQEDDIKNCLDLLKKEHHSADIGVMHGN